MMNRILFCALFLPLTLVAQTTAFQISGTVKTQEKDKGEKREVPRGDTQLEVETKALEITLRRTNPNVGAQATVQWAVFLKGYDGKVRIGTKGQRDLQTSVGVPVEISSGSFEIRSREFDFDHRRGHDLEQEVEGYVIRILDTEGNEIGVKFQPASIEEKSRELLSSSSRAEERDWSKGAFPNRPRQIRPKELR